MNDLMIDIETLGTSPHGAIVAVGAVFFDLASGEIGAEFEAAVSLASSQELGMKIDASTVQWWLRQSPKAILAWSNEHAASVREVLSKLSVWIGANGKKHTNVWANAPTFDLAILRHAYGLAGMVVPWHHTQECCVRTLVKLSFRIGFDPKLGKREGTAHRAVDDCLHQIKYCHAAWRAVNQWV